MHRGWRCAASARVRNLGVRCARRQERGGMETRRRVWRESSSIRPILGEGGWGRRRATHGRRKKKTHTTKTGDGAVGEHERVAQQVQRLREGHGDVQLQGGGALREVVVRLA
ncbi:hypothetical protein C8J57DRAFT_1224828 [Mycena rebaudengoi]|nr:hypothetical protein C8J57DRAFT_1224828 [Mycena rebaudengoi]